MIRPLEQADIPAVAALMGVVSFESPAPTPAGLAHWFSTQPSRARFRTWVAEEEGTIVGSAWGMIEWGVSTGDVAWLWAGVLPQARGRGLGTALLAAVEAPLVEAGARKLDSFALEGSEGEGFLTKRGYRRTRVELVQRLDLAALDLPGAPQPAEGVRVASLREIADRTTDLHAVYAAASEDIPAEEPEDDIRYDEFVPHILGDPELDPDGSTVVLVNDRPAALAFLLVNRAVGAAMNEMTGTLPDFRGRGLARLAKRATIEWARAEGLRELVTENDEENAAMRALNASLGYRVSHRRIQLRREIDS
jgi:GNAT superfamily N-acetyltransferase